MPDENEVPDDSDGAEGRVELDMVPVPVVPTEPALPDVTDDWEVPELIDVLYVPEETDAPEAREVPDATGRYQ